jgi:hypothetical protein
MTTKGTISGPVVGETQPQSSTASRGHDNHKTPSTSVGSLGQNINGFVATGGNRDYNPSASSMGQNMNGFTATGGNREYSPSASSMGQIMEVVSDAPLKQTVEVVSNAPLNKNGDDDEGEQVVAGEGTAGQSIPPPP